MNLRERIARRQRTDREPRLVHDYDALNPTIHLEEPIGRGPTLERLLDHVEPAFEGVLPPNGYVYGPKGSGKSATLTALFSHLAAMTGTNRTTIFTTTRGGAARPTEFVYVDARTATSDFALYHSVLDALTEEDVPEQGLGTAKLRERLATELREYDRTVMVALDHVGEPETRTAEGAAELFSPFPSLSWLFVGRDPPDGLDGDARLLEFSAYRHHALVDVLTARVSSGLARHALTHEQIREVAEWGDGDAHDALATLFGAADAAVAAGHGSVLPEDVDEGMAAVPRPCVSLGRVLALPGSRKRVLRALLELEDDRRDSVGAAAEAIAADEGVDLSTTTVKRVLYELSETGITRRVTHTGRDGLGRPPSRLEPRFPTRVFSRLFDEASAGEGRRP
jgi:Cdc6-like AAA superfamily ATPase